MTAPDNATQSGEKVPWFVWLIGLPVRPHRGPMSEAEARAWVAAAIEPIYRAGPEKKDRCPRCGKDALEPFGGQPDRACVECGWNGPEAPEPPLSGKDGGS